MIKNYKLFIESRVNSEITINGVEIKNSLHCLYGKNGVYLLSVETHSSFLDILKIPGLENLNWPFNPGVSNGLSSSNIFNLYKKQYPYFFVLIDENRECPNRVIGISMNKDSHIFCNEYSAQIDDIEGIKKSLSKIGITFDELIEL